MRSLLLALVLLGCTLPQQQVTDPTFIIIFSLKRDKPTEPYMEFRILINAKSEGEATMKATILIQKTFGINALEILEFKESAAKKN